MGYTYYNPLKVWLDPASIADVVSYMQKYLSENPIKDTEEINQIIADYIAAHPEIIGGVQSVNGETGEVVLTASDINTTGTTTIQAVLTSLSSQISDITQTVTVLDTRVTANTTGITNEATARANADTALDNRINALQGSVGSPLLAATAAAMTDTTKIYVYTGSESGYTNGNWYYYNGASWTSGGVYNAVAINTDTTLTVAGMAADAKATGDGLNDLKSAIHEDTEEKYLPLWFASGGISSTGGTQSNTSRIRTVGALLPKVVEGDCVIVKKPYSARLMFYQNTMSAGYFVEGYPADFANGIISIPSEYKGNQVAILIRNDNTPSGDISGEVSTIDEYVYYWRTKKNENSIDSVTSSLFKNNITSEYELFLNGDKYITLSSGEGTSSNISNPSTAKVIGTYAFLNATPENPLMISMDDDYCYDVYFYNGATQSGFVGHTGYLKGKTVLNGVYDGTTYSHVRFNIVYHDRSEGMYLSIVSAFNVYRIDSFLGGSPGETAASTKRFNVTVNLNWPKTSNTDEDTEETNTETGIMCILRLPSTYRRGGKPVPLIMFGHGASAQITDEMWYNNSSNFTALINAFVTAGYAVFDVNNTRNAVGGFPDWGCLPLMNAYIKAWQYIKHNYNVEKKLYIFSDSMGTCANLNMLKWYGSEIVTSIMTAPRPVCKARYETMTGIDKTNFEAAFDITSGAWENRLNGFNHYENIVNINNTQYVFEKFPPVKVMVGTGDTDFLSETRAYYTALANNGNYVNYREVEDADHAKMSFLSDAALRDEAVEWFDRFRYKTT